MFDSDWGHDDVITGNHHPKLDTCQIKIRLRHAFPAFG